MSWEGVYVASITPFGKDGALALPTLRRHLEWLAESGVDGFVPLGTTGEGATVTAEERRAILSLAVEVARERKVRVIAGCGGNDTATVVALTQEAASLGCDGALVVTPYYNKPTPAGLVAHYRRVADDGGLPIILYNVPGRTNVMLSVSTISELFEHPNIVGLKEASGNYAHWMQLATTVNLKEKALLAGDDDALTLIQALGGRGIITACANVIPKQLVALYRLGREGKWDEAFSLQKRIYPLVRSLFLETNPSPAKYALELLGRGENSLRLPLVPVQPPTEAAIRAAMQAMELLA